MYNTKEFSGNTVQKNTKQQKKASVKKGTRKNRLNRIILILFTLLYLPALWNWIFHDNIDTEMLHTGILEMKIPAEGVFVRKETAITATKEGIIIPKVNQQERVPNKFVFALLADKNSRQTLEQINRLEKEIIRHAIEENPESLDGDSETRNKVQNEVNKLTKTAINKSMESVRTITSALEQLIYNRNINIFQSREDKLYLKNEKEELNHYKNLLNSNSVEIISDFSGLIVWDDSYDEKYSHDNMEQLIPEDLIIKNRKDEEYYRQLISINEFFEVEKDQIFARLIDNEKTWYVCVIDLKRAESIKQGDNIILKTEGLEKSFPCIVESVKAMGDKTKIILSINQMVEETVLLKHTKANLVVNSVTGLKIPLRSLTNINSNDNTADVILVRLNRAVIKRVKIIAQQDAIAIIDVLPNSKETDPVRVFDVFVVNPKNINEGQVIE